MIPQLRRIGTSRATEIVDEWAGIATSCWGARARGAFAGWRLTMGF
jgi:hypothetical protein